MERVGETGSQEEAGGRAALHSPLSALPREAGDSSLAWGRGWWRPQLSLLRALRPLGSPHRARAGSAAQRPLQVAIKDLLCPPQVLGNFQLYSLASLLVGVNCGEQGVARIHPSLGRRLGVWAPMVGPLPSTGGSAYFCGRSGASDPHACSWVLLWVGNGQGRRGKEGGWRGWEPGPSLCLHPFQLASTPRWPPSHPGKGQRGDFHVCFPEEEKESPREHMPSSISDAPCERGQNGGQDWRAKEFTGRA